MALTALERKVELVKTGISQAQIARDLDVSEPHVSQVMSGERRSPRVEAKIAEVLGRPVEEVFESVVVPTRAAS